MQIEGRNNTTNQLYFSLDDDGNISVNQIIDKKQEKHYPYLFMYDIVIPGTSYIAYSFLCKTHQKWEIKIFTGNRLHIPSIQRELSLLKLANDCVLANTISRSRVGRSSFITAASILNLIRDLPHTVWGIAVTTGRQDVSTVMPDNVINCINKFVRKNFLVAENSDMSIPLTIHALYARDANKEYILASNQWQLIHETEDGAIISHPIISLPANQWEHPSEFRLLLLPDVSHDDKGYMIRIPPRISNVDTARKWLYRAKKTDKFAKEV